VHREPLSPGARAFVSAYIHSVRQLELLLLLHARRTDRWTPAEVAAELRVAPDWAAMHLDAMRASGLLDTDDADVPSYRYAPSPREDAVVAELADAYRRRKPTVIQAVLSTMGSDVQALSDAFRVRRRADG
jgi:predicted ArsR family transcriptional regulator